MWEKSTDMHPLFLSLLEVPHFMDHLMQGVLDYAPGRFCPVLGVSWDMGISVLNLGKSQANWGNCSPKFLRTNKQWVNGLQSPFPALVPTNNHSFATFISFTYWALPILLYKKKSSVAKKCFINHYPSHHSPDGLISQSLGGSKAQCFQGSDSKD